MQINEQSLFGYFFGRIETILLIAMSVLAINLFYAFVEYIAGNAKFLETEAHRYNFSARLVGTLLFVEIVLSLSTSYFRSLNELDKALFTAVVSFCVALFNHWTITEMFENYLKHQKDLDIESIQWKLYLSNWLVFVIGEAVSWVMHSKGKRQEPTNPDLLAQIQALLQTNQPSPTPTLYNAIGEPTKANQIGFDYNHPHDPTQPYKVQDPTIQPPLFERVITLYKSGLSEREIGDKLEIKRNQVRNILDRANLLKKGGERV